MSILLCLSLLILLQLLISFISQFQFATAFFWAEKAATLSNNSAEDIYNMAKALFLDRQFKRAAYILENSNFYKV